VYLVGQDFVKLLLLVLLLSLLLLLLLLVCGVEGESVTLLVSTLLFGVWFSTRGVIAVVNFFLAPDSNDSDVATLLAVYRAPALIMI